MTIVKEQREWPEALHGQLRKVSRNDLGKDYVCIFVERWMGPTGLIVIDSIFEVGADGWLREPRE